MKLNDRELATVLAALRCFQQYNYSEKTRMYPDHFADVEPLGFDEIDKLCERLN